MSIDKKSSFMDEFASSLKSGSFVKATFGNYQGSDEQLQRLLIRRLMTRKGIRVSLLYRYGTRDVVKNHEVGEALQLLEKKLGSEFFSGHLFTIEADFQIEQGRRGSFALHRSKPTFESVPSLDHDREKQSAIDAGRYFLKALSVTNEKGIVYKGRRNKWKQINKFVEILKKRIREAGLAGKQSLEMVDMGCGKGYLTFAAYDYLKNTLGIPDVSVVGIDENPDLTRHSNKIAGDCGFDGLSFQTGTIKSYRIEDADILVALHACDTASDDAIYKGIEAGVPLILVAPCCHKELRPQIEAPEAFEDLLSHGSLLERQAELITDGLRSLLLQERGYAARVFEFVASEHTPKNNMISAVKTGRIDDSERYRRQIDEIKKIFGIKSLRLEHLLKK